MLKGEAEEEYVVQDSAIRALKAFLDKQAVELKVVTLATSSDASQASSSEAPARGFLPVTSRARC
jgi:hypothetical protein